MKFFSFKALFCLFVSCLITGTRAQSLQDLSFGSDTTFDVITWNIEDFPKYGNATADSVATIIKAIDADVIAFQEITDTTLFKQMISNIPDMGWYFQSSWYGGLAYAYNTNTVQIESAYEILTTSTYWTSLPRSPLVLEILFNNKKLVLLNNHLKCCGDGMLDLTDSWDEENRRWAAMIYLKNYIDFYLDDENVILLGDLNDMITDLPSNNVFNQILEDTMNYRFADFDIAWGSSLNWSYPSWPSHLDHILITNELYTALEHPSSNVRTLLIDDYLPNGFYTYNQRISDHLPVGMSLFTDAITTVPEPNNGEKISVFPNPFNDQLSVSGLPSYQTGELTIYDGFGRVLDRLGLNGESSYTWHAGELSPGLYFLKVTLDNEIITTSKLVYSGN